MGERGTAEEKVTATVEHGEQFIAKFGRTGFRRNFAFERERRGKHYGTKQVEAFAVREDSDWLAVVFHDIVLIFLISLTWLSPTTSYTICAVDAGGETRDAMGARVPRFRSERS
jgi:hypothetical protein